MTLLRVATMPRLATWSCLAALICCLSLPAAAAEPLDIPADVMRVMALR